MVNEATAEIKARVEQKQTLVVLPEGVMLNYLTRRVNSTRHSNFMPDGMLIFGEDEILQTLRDHPPDFIMIVHKDTADFGLPFFGQDYGESIYAWVQDGYEEVWLIGNRPIEKRYRFGMLLMQRR